MKFVSKANVFMPLQVLAMLNSTYPAERRDLCFVFNPIGKKKNPQAISHFFLPLKLRKHEIVEGTSEAANTFLEYK